MPNPNIAVSTELDAVNQILSSVGQAAVTTLDMQNPEVFAVVTALRNTDKQVQSEGWSFNSISGKKFSPDAASKKIQVPIDVLQMYVNKEKHYDKYNIVRKEGYLYDKYSCSHEFEEDIYMDVIYLRAFGDLPPAFQAHIIAKAARISAIRLVGSSELVQLLAIDEEMTKTAMLDYETKQGDYSIFGFKDGQNYYNSYQPFQTLAR